MGEWRLWLKFCVVSVWSSFMCGKTTLLTKLEVSMTCFSAVQYLCPLGTLFFFPEGGVGQTQVWMPALFASILRIAQMIWVLESDGGIIYWQGKTEELGEKPVPAPLCPPEIPHGLTGARTRASAVRGQWLNDLSHGTA
jgi:hypothetical protein